MSTPLEQAYLVVQNDWEEAIGDEGGSFWITCKKGGMPGKHGTVSNTRVDAGNKQVSASPGFRVGELKKYAVDIYHDDPNAYCKFIAKQATFNAIHKKSVVAIDVTTSGLGVSASTDNKLQIWDTSNGTVRRTLEGHVGDVYTCRFFPSGVVVLSAGADIQLKIWSAETGQCPVSLKGHTGAILDTAIVDRGRNIISCGKDGTARLWDCGQSMCIAKLYEGNGDINGCALGIGDNSLNLTTSREPNEREVGTEGKLLLLACENNNLVGVGVRNKKELFKFTCTSAVNCCAFLSEAEFVCACQDGRLYQIDVRNVNEPVASWMNSGAAVLSLLPYKKGFLASKSDSVCSYYSAVSGEKTFQLTGPDCDPVYKVVTDGSSIYTCCRDGLIRKYRV